MRKGVGDEKNIWEWEMKRIYVAGSYNAENIIKCLNNIKRGTQTCVKLLKKGYVPFCPWLDYQFHWYGDLTIDDYYRYSIGWLPVCDAILVLPDSHNSKGTQKEIEKAKELKIPIYIMESMFEEPDYVLAGRPYWT